MSGSADAETKDLERPLSEWSDDEVAEARLKVLRKYTGGLYH